MNEVEMNFKIINKDGLLNYLRTQLQRKLKISNDLPRKHGDESFYIRIEEMSDKNGNKKQNWPKIFIRYERFPNNFNEHLISQLPINIPEKCIDKPDDLLIPFQIHIKDEYLFHTPDLSMNLSKMLIKNETDYKFIETPNLMPFSANSEHGKAIRKDKKTFFI